MNTNFFFTPKRGTQAHYHIWTQQDLFIKGLYEITETKRFDLTTKGQLAEQELFDCCLFSSKKHSNILYSTSYSLYEHTLFTP